MAFRNFSTQKSLVASSSFRTVGFCLFKVRLLVIDAYFLQLGSVVQRRSLVSLVDLELSRSAFFKRTLIENSYLKC